MRNECAWARGFVPGEARKEPELERELNLEDWADLCRLGESVLCDIFAAELVSGDCTRGGDSEASLGAILLDYDYDFDLGEAAIASLIMATIGGIGTIIELLFIIAGSEGRGSFAPSGVSGVPILVKTCIGTSAE